MKQLIFVVLAVSLLSCSNEKVDVAQYQWKIDSLENQIHALSVLVGKVTHEKDSLSPYAERWKYGKDYSKYADDYSGGNSISWRCARAAERITFDESLLSKEEIRKSNRSSYTVHNVTLSDMFSDKFVVNSKFERDRCNYLISVFVTDYLNEMISNAAADYSNKCDVPRYQQGVVMSTYQGLIYKDMYRNLHRNQDQFIEIANEFYKVLSEL